MPNAHRVGMGGIAIECSTFSPLPTTLDDFTVLRGEELLNRYRFMLRSDVDWRPSLYARAIPGGPLTPVTYWTLKGELLERIRATLPLNGFYFDIHGAMAVQGLDDAEADLAAAIRRLLGPDCLISASMDLHGNVSARLVELVDLFTAYRHAPHIDAEKTRERACANLLFCLDNAIQPVRGWVRVPVILPGERTSTRVEPGRTVFAGLSELDEAAGILDASLWVGYVWADEPRSGASVVVTGTDSTRVRQEAARLARGYWTARADFGLCAPAGNMDWCIAQALNHSGERPVVISDSGDNPTGGGVGDTPYALARLLAQPCFASGERTAIFASIADAAAVAECFAADVGREVRLSVGGKLDPVHGRPLAVTGTVEKLVADDPVGGRIAVVCAGGVHAIITSRRKPFHRLRDFTDLSLNPAEHDVVVVKIGYLEPELQHLARCALLALTPGAVDQDIRGLTYTRVTRPVYPLDEAMADPEFTVRLFPDV